jgi:hypothetical protein
MEADLLLRSACACAAHQGLVKAVIEGVLIASASPEVSVAGSSGSRSDAPPAHITASV